MAKGFVRRGGRALVFYGDDENLALARAVQKRQTEIAPSSLATWLVRTSVYAIHLANTAPLVKTSRRQIRIYMEMISWKIPCAPPSLNLGEA